MEISKSFCISSRCFVSIVPMSRYYMTKQASPHFTFLIENHQCQDLLHISPLSSQQDHHSSYHSSTTLASPHHSITTTTTSDYFPIPSHQHVQPSHFISGCHCPQPPFYSVRHSSPWLDSSRHQLRLRAWLVDMFPLHPPEQSKAVSSAVRELPTPEMWHLYNTEGMMPFESLKRETSVSRRDSMEAPRGRLAHDAGENAWNEGIDLGESRRALSLNCFWVLIHCSSGIAWH